jgi:hypothetical protein
MRSVINNLDPCVCEPLDDARFRVVCSRQFMIEQDLIIPD